MQLLDPDDPVGSICWTCVLGSSFPCGHQSCHLYNGHLIMYSRALPAPNPDAFLCLQECQRHGVGWCGAYLAQSSTERRRWAMSSTVHCANQLPRAACIWRSVPGSTAAVASSRMRIWVFRRRARAKHRSCFWPTLGRSGTVRSDVCTSGLTPRVCPQMSPLPTAATGAREACPYLWVPSIGILILPFLSRVTLGKSYKSSVPQSPHL